MRWGSNLRDNKPKNDVEKFEKLLVAVVWHLNKHFIYPTVDYVKAVLYFCDLDYYEKFEKQLAGMTYRRVGNFLEIRFFDDVLKNLIRQGILEIHNGRLFTDYKPPLQRREARFVASKVESLHKFSEDAIWDYLRRDIPFLSAFDGDVIEYESVFYRSFDYSVRLREKELE
ncbi:MAG: hypothetical protein QXP36_03320 [Conexivisphaerales archaeon]